MWWYRAPTCKAHSVLLQGRVKDRVKCRLSQGFGFRLFHGPLGFQVSKGLWA